MKKMSDADTPSSGRRILNWDGHEDLLTRKREIENNSNLKLITRRQGTQTIAKIVHGVTKSEAKERADREQSRGGLNSPVKEILCCRSKGYWRKKGVQKEQWGGREEECEKGVEN